MEVRPCSVLDVSAIEIVHVSGQMIAIRHVQMRPQASHQVLRRLCILLLIVAVDAGNADSCCRQLNGAKILVYHRPGNVSHVPCVVDKRVLIPKVPVWLT